jgi:leucyl aminopeptidase
MDIRLLQGKWNDTEAATLIVAAWDKDSARDGALDGATSGWIEEVYASGEFAGAPGDLAVLHRPSGLKARRLAVAGAGKPEKFNEQALRKVTGAAVRALKSKSLRDLHLFLPPQYASAAFVQAAVEAAVLADYEPDQLKTDTKKGDKRLQSFAVVVDASNSELEAAAQRGRIVAEAQNFARDLVNEPANLLTPLSLADYARNMAAEFGLSFDVLDEAQMRELGMGALLGVS